MLFLTRNVGQKIVISDKIVIKILNVNSAGHVSIGVDAPKDVAVHREEIYRKMSR